MAVEALCVGHLLRTFPGKVSGFITVETRRSGSTFIRTCAGQVSGLVAVKTLHNALGRTIPGQVSGFLAAETFKGALFRTLPGKVTRLLAVKAGGSRTLIGIIDVSSSVSVSSIFRFFLIGVLRRAAGPDGPVLLHLDRSHLLRLILVSAALVLPLVLLLAVLARLGRSGGRLLAEVHDLGDRWMVVRQLGSIRKGNFLTAFVGELL